MGLRFCACKQDWRSLKIFCWIGRKLKMTFGISPLFHKRIFGLQQFHQKVVNISLIHNGSKLFLSILVQRSFLRAFKSLASISYVNTCEYLIKIRGHSHCGIYRCFWPMSSQNYLHIFQHVFALIAKSHGSDKKNTLGVKLSLK